MPINLTSLSLHLDQSNLFIKCVFVVITLICTSQVVFQTYLLINTDFKNSLDDCGYEARIFRIVGLHNLTHLSVLNITRFFISDFIILIITLIFFIITQRIYDSATQRLDERLVNNDEIDQTTEHTEHHSSDSFNQDGTHGEFYNRFRYPIEMSSSKAIQNKVKLLRLVQITKYFFEMFFLGLLGGCAILNPSVLSFNYFFILLFILTWFGFNKQFTSFYVYLRMLVCLIAVGHLLVLFAYQFNEVNSVIKSDDFYPRLFGLTQYTQIECKPYFYEEIRVLNWNIYIHPVLLSVLYLTSIYMIKYHYKDQNQKVTIIINTTD